jgi:hypothetical protein
VHEKDDYKRVRFTNREKTVSYFVLPQFCGLLVFALLIINLALFISSGEPTICDKPYC